MREKIDTPIMSELPGIENFFLHGYYLDENLGMDFSDYKSMNFKDCNDKDEDSWLDKRYLSDLKKIQEFFADRYISSIFTNYELKDCGMWEGVDDGSSKWHNDYLDGDTFNSNILVYLDDNTIENGNSIEVRGPGFTHKLYPKANQLIWLNQKRIFEHRATHSSGRRRILSFEYFIPELV